MGKINFNESIRHWLYLGLLLVFIIILMFTILSFQYISTGRNIPFYLVFFVEYHSFFMFFIAIFGVIFGSVSQLMTSKRIENDREKLDILKKHFFNSISNDERKIIDYMIKNNGISTQYELTKLENMNKLKVSRLLVDMEKKKLISKKKIGKINKVFLDKELLKIYSS